MCVPSPPQPWYRSYDMVKSKDWHNALARTLRWRYLVLDEGENSSTWCVSGLGWSDDGCGLCLHMA